MTHDDALKVCALLDPQVAGVGHSVADHGKRLVDHLRLLWPEFQWRLFMSRQFKWSSWALTVDPGDPREHRVPKGGVCVHCDKTALELGVREQE